MEILKKIAEVETNPRGRTMTIEEVKEVASDYDPDGFISTFAEPNRIFSREVLEVAQNLKVIGWVGVAFEHFDLDAATERGVYCTFLKDIAEKWIATSLADGAFALMLCAARKLHLADRYTKEGRWVTGGCYPALALMGAQISGTTIGIIGMGRIGGEVAKRAAKGFNMKCRRFKAVHTDANPGRYIKEERDELIKIGAELILTQCNGNFPFQLAMRHPDPYCSYRQ